MIANSIFHVDSCWFFDYDLTLYGEDEAMVLEQLDRRITRYLEKYLEVDARTADQIRREYCELYGTTLQGLMREHNSSPDDYFDYLHGGNELVYPAKKSDLVELISSFPGKKAVFTNGRADWVCKGLQGLGLMHVFERIIDLEVLDWMGKPYASAYEKACRLMQCDPSSAILLDDKVCNLEEAARQGWTTVLVGSAPVKNFSPHAHIVRIEDLANLMETSKR